MYCNVLIVYLVFSLCIVFIMFVAQAVTCKELCDCEEKCYKNEFDVLTSVSMRAQHTAAEVNTWKQIKQVRGTFLTDWTTQAQR